MLECQQTRVYKREQIVTNATNPDKVRTVNINNRTWATRSRRSTVMVHCTYIFSLQSHTRTLSIRTIPYEMYLLSRTNFLFMNYVLLALCTRVTTPSLINM